MRVLVAMLVALCSVFSSRARAQDLEMLSEARTQDGLPYRLFRPATNDPAVKYPLVIYLHGAGQRGTNNVGHITQWNDMLKPLFTAANRAQFPAFVLAPQCPPTNNQKWVDWPWENGSYDLDKVPESAPMKKVRAAIAAVRAEFNVDPDRVYVMGVSMGGFGTWDLIARTPDQFAGAVAADGGTPPGAAARLRNMAVWWFHNADDGTVKVASDREMFAALAAAGGRPTYSEWAMGGHVAMSRVGGNKEVLPWLFAQRRGVPATPVPALTFSGAQTVTLTSSITGAKIRYTTDGTLPAADRGTAYVQPFSVSGSGVLQAVAITGQGNGEARVFHAEAYPAGNAPGPDAAATPAVPDGGSGPERDARAPAEPDTRTSTPTSTPEAGAGAADLRPAARAPTATQPTGGSDDVPPARSSNGGCALAGRPGNGGGMAGAGLALLAALAVARRRRGPRVRS